MKSPRIISLENRTWIEHRHTRSEVATDPLDRSSLLDYGPLCIEIVGVDRPVLDGRVSHLGSLTDIDLDTTRVQ